MKRWQQADAGKDYHGDPRTAQVTELPPLQCRQDFIHILCCAVFNGLSNAEPVAIYADNHDAGHRSNYGQEQSGYVRHGGTSGW
jgi:hypothetical protein